MARIPQLRRHRGKQLGYARFDGRQIYFGKWPNGHKSPPVEVRQAFERHLEKWLARRKASPALPSGDVTIDELWLAYLEHCQSYYRKNGSITSEVSVIRSACRIVARLYGDEPAEEFTPGKLKAVRQKFIEAGWSRESINKQVSRVRGMFRWAVENEWVPVAVLDAMKTVSPLKAGRTEARETADIRPVPIRDIASTLRELRSPMREMVRLQYLLGCRCQDIREMRSADIVGNVYRPSSHKVEHHGIELAYHLGPKALRLLEPFLAAAKEYVFPSSLALRCSTHYRGRPYTRWSYRTAIQRACKRAGVTPWTPLQLRHTRLTEIRRRYGAEASQTVAQHKNLRTTEIYAERNAALARRIMDEIG